MTHLLHFTGQAALVNSLWHFFHSSNTVFSKVKCEGWMVVLFVSCVVRSVPGLMKDASLFEVLDVLEVLGSKFNSVRDVVEDVSLVRIASGGDKFNVNHAANHDNHNRAQNILFEISSCDKLGTHISRGHGSILHYRHVEEKSK